MKRNKQTDGMSQKHVDEKEKMLKTELKNCRHREAAEITKNID